MSFSPDKTALPWLDRDELLHTDMLEALRRGLGYVAAAEEELGDGASLDALVRLALRKAAK